MSPSRTLSLYIARRFLLWVGAIGAAMFGIVCLVETIELLRRASGNENVGLSRVLEMALLKAPSTCLEALPFIVLASTLATYWQLNRSSELIVARGSGVSAWQFLMPTLACVLLVAIARVVGVDPLAASMFAQFDALEHRYLVGGPSVVSASANGLWLRQSDGARQSIIHARQVAAADAVLHPITVFTFAEGDRLLSRIDAPRGRLSAGFWNLDRAWITQPNEPARYAESYRIATSLTFDQIADSFAPAQAVSFWRLPRYIGGLEATGFSAREHRLQLHRLLSIPLLLAGMVVLAAAFSLRPQRFGATFMLIGAGGLSGFLLYFLSYFSFKLGLNASIPLVLAAWAPAGLGALVGSALLLHMEDG